MEIMSYVDNFSKLGSSILYLFWATTTQGASLQPRIIDGNNHVIIKESTRLSLIHLEFSFFESLLCSYKSRVYEYENCLIREARLLHTVPAALYTT